MFFLNFYAKEFSVAEVKSMADMGICADMVVEQRRDGSISDVDLTGFCMSSLGSKYKELLESQVEGVRLEPILTGTPGYSGQPMSPTQISEFQTDVPEIVDG